MEIMDVERRASSKIEAMILKVVVEPRLMRQIISAPTEVR